jgi:hypothetical protein
VDTDVSRQIQRATAATLNDVGRFAGPADWLSDGICRNTCPRVRPRRTLSMALLTWCLAENTDIQHVMPCPCSSVGWGERQQGYGMPFPSLIRSYASHGQGVPIRHRANYSA